MPTTINSKLVRKQTMLQFRICVLALIAICGVPSSSIGQESRQQAPAANAKNYNHPVPDSELSVSYTHLTLPTIYSV